MADFFATEPALAIAVIVGLGAAAQWIAWRINLPAILPLLITGFVVGPLLGWLEPAALFGDDLLFPSISLAVGLILFEGGLTLSLPEVRETRGVVIRMVTVGALVTWIGATLAASVFLGLPTTLAFLFGALVIVTGPTVIGPLLRIVRPEARIGNILKWEGILVDVIGAMVAVLVFEYLLIGDRQMALGQTLLLFLRFIAMGAVVGVTAGALLALILRRRWLPDYLVNLVALAMVFTAFAIANALAPEAGLLAAVLMGMIVANIGVPNIHSILSFKEDLTVLFISLLFVVLAAHIQMSSFVAALSWGSLALLLTVMFVIRPLSVFASTFQSNLTLKEKLYLSWVAPRGIVAAAVSSLFGTRLVAAGFEGAEVIAPLVFLVIVGTVLLSSLTAKPVAQLLGLAEPDPQGFLILGAHPFARRIASFLKDESVPVMLADTNWANIASARVEGLPAYYGSLLSTRSDDEIRLSGIGRLLALTSNEEANALAALKYARQFGSQNVFQLAAGRTGRGRDDQATAQRGRHAFARPVRYDELEQMFIEGAVIKKTPLTEKFGLPEYLDRYGEDHVPMFAVQGGRVRILTEEGSLPEAGSTIVSLVPAERDEKARTDASPEAA